ncbi:MAG TPA: hypothetical protein VFJ58_26715 [Armatimonadota bacterium]|nr:hypothetical protein [Armatimonadota bacterium]
MDNSTPSPPGACRIRLPDPFDLRNLALGHGWAQLDPFQWDNDAGRLAHATTFPDGRVAEWEVSQMTQESLDIRVSSGNAADYHAAVEAISWSLRLEDSFADFHALCEQYPALTQAARERQGRLLRSPTVWEDVAKTICTTCTTWARTREMITALCREWGTPGPRRHGFPTPAAIAAAEENDLRRATGMGYRARYLKALAAAQAEGRLDLEAFKTDSRPGAEIRASLLALPGIGPYAAANLLMLLGRYDYLAVDSWVRRVVGKSWFRGRPVTDAEILAAFEPFHRWTALVYWYWDWDAAEEWTWRPGRAADTG